MQSSIEEVQVDGIHTINQVHRREAMDDLMAQPQHIPLQRIVVLQLLNKGCETSQYLR